MNDRRREDRIALLLAQGQAQRLGAQLAILEAHDQLSPLRSVATALRAVARMVGPGRTPSSVAGMVAKFSLGHPWIVSLAAPIVMRLLRRRPLALAVAAAAGVAAWWLLRPSPAQDPTERTQG